MVIQNKSWLSCFSFSFPGPGRPDRAAANLACDACHERAKLFLSRCEPGHQRRGGVLLLRDAPEAAGKSRLSYWKFVLMAEAPLR
jgi:hypothetical protein